MSTPLTAEGLLLTCMVIGVVTVSLGIIYLIVRYIKRKLKNKLEKSKNA